MRVTHVSAAVLLILALAVPAFCQAPDRRDEVAAITRSHPEIFGSDDTRRDGLKLIVCGLNQQDGGQWGRLAKLDQGGKIPADIIVWQPTREHFDVLTDAGPNWGPVGVLDNPRWIWSAVDCASSAPAPVIVPPPTQPPPVIVMPSNGELIALLEKIIENQQQAFVVAKDTNVRVANMDRTLTQTLGSFTKFVGKYIAPAVAGFIAAKQLTKPPTEATATP